MDRDSGCYNFKIIQVELGIIIALFLLFIKDYHKINNMNDNNNNNPNKNSNPNHNSNTNTNNITIFSRERL